jgi:hypothetical protein
LNELNDQHDISPAAEVEQPERQPREPSMNEVAARISEHLLVTEDAQRTRIRRLVWDLVNVVKSEQVSAPRASKRREG